MHTACYYNTTTYTQEGFASTSSCFYSRMLMQHKRTDLCPQQHDACGSAVGVGARLLTYAQDVCKKSGIKVQKHHSSLQPYIVHNLYGDKQTYTYTRRRCSISKLKPQANRNLLESPPPNPQHAHATKPTHTPL